ncbi:MAG: TIR domain-containing protein [Leptolyngbyaceae cyanobacterium SM2_5_2]|nr:TIR domain-containing protein [Leptolyngbyaceae cyanobacterium SM2_5_2]
MAEEVLRTDLDVFISYSRRDKEFVQVLTHHLETCDRTYWIDWRDILPLTEWRQEIRQGILAANSFLFVMSPHSLISDECLKEVECAVSVNKRLVPIVCQDISECSVPAALEKINWIFFYGAENFEQPFQELQLALDRDLDYVKGHTRLLKLADEWDNQQRDDSFLLRGSRLEATEAWLYQKFTQSPALTQLQLDFVATSRLTETQRQKRDMRHQRIALGATVATLMVVTGLGLLTEVRRREAIRQELSALNYASATSLALDKPFEALQLGVRANRQLQKSRWIQGPLRAETVSALSHAAYRVQEKNILEGHSGHIYGIDFSADGQRLASASLDGTVKLWQPDGAVISTLSGPDGGALLDVSFSPDGQTLGAGGADAMVYLWNQAGELLQRLSGHQDWITYVRFSPDGQRLASASVDGTVKLWQPDGLALATLPGNESMVLSVRFNPVNQTLVSASLDGRLNLWRPDGALIKTIQASTDIYEARFSADGTTLAAAGADGTVTLWSPEGNLLKTFEPIASEGLTSLDISPNGELVAAAGTDRIIRIWRQDGTLVTTLPGHQASVQHLAFSPDGTWLASAGEDLTLRLWQWDNPWMERLQGHSQAINGLAINPQTQQVVSGSQDGTLKLWSLEGEVLQTLDTAAGWINDVAVSPDGRWIVGVGQESDTAQVGLVQLWTATGESKGVLARQGQWVNVVAFSPNSQLMASASDDGRIQILGLDGQIQQTLELGTNVLGVEFSPDGQLLAAAGLGTLRVWRLADSELVNSYDGSISINDLSFSPDSQTLVFANSDRTVGLWPLNEPEPRFLDKAHGGEVKAVQFSPDGRQFASAGQDNMIGLWSASGEEIVTIGSHDAPITTLQFTADGSKLVTGSEDNTLIIWDLSILTPDRLVSWSCDWLAGYLQNNPNVAAADRKLCQGVVPWSAEP